eukprot:1467665-Pleurochrysis_carterae.AAC.8
MDLIRCGSKSQRQASRASWSDGTRCSVAAGMAGRGAASSPDGRQPVQRSRAQSSFAELAFFRKIIFSEAFYMWEWYSKPDLRPIKPRHSFMIDVIFIEQNGTIIVFSTAPHMHIAT